MPYLLDTNAVIAVLNDPTSRVGRRLRQESPADVMISAIVSHELFFGAFKSRRVSQNVARIEMLQFTVIAFTGDDARQAGEIRGRLASLGTPIGPYDVLIAGQALARNLTLVTRNMSEFRRIPALSTEDWEN
jgi:tRNA(fMet)-specific endonuclease VapC